MDRGLLISVGVTILAVGLLFIYFRNKVSGIEKKVELMFNLIQNYEGSNNMAQSQQPVMAMPENVYENNYNQTEQVKTDLIEVSDDDSDEVSDSEDESDEEETLSFDTTDVQLDESDIKTIELDNSEKQENKNEDSLDEIDDSEDEAEQEELEEIDTDDMLELTEDDYKKDCSRIKTNCRRKGTPKLQVFKTFDSVITEPVGFFVIKVDIELPFY